MVQDTYSEVNLRIAGNLSTFDQDQFVSDMADILEIDSRLIDIVSVTEGSVIILFHILDADGVDSKQVAENLENLVKTNDPSLSEAGITVLDISVDTSNSAAEQDGSSSSGLSTGGIVAIAVIVPIAAIALVGIAFFAYKKKNEGGSAGKNTVEMKNIDNKKKGADEETGTATSDSDSDSDEDSSDETSDSDSETGSSDSDSETGSSETGSETGTSTGSESESGSSESGTSESSSN